VERKTRAADDTTSADTIKAPATVEQAARVLDLSTFPLMDGAKSASRVTLPTFLTSRPAIRRKPWNSTGRRSARKAGKSLPNSTISDESASAMFARDGFRRLAVGHSL